MLYKVIEVADAAPVNPELRAIVDHLDRAGLDDGGVMLEPQDLRVRLALRLTTVNV